MVKFLLSSAVLEMGTIVDFQVFDKAPSLIAVPEHFGLTVTEILERLPFLSDE